MEVDSDIASPEMISDVIRLSQDLLQRLDGIESVVASEAEKALTVDRVVLTNFRLGAELIGRLTDKITAHGPPAFDQWDDAKLSSFVQQTEGLLAQIDALLPQFEQVRRGTTNAEIIGLVGHSHPQHLRLYGVLQEHLAMARECEADRDIAAGRVKKFGNAAAAVAFLRRHAR